MINSGITADTDADTPTDAYVNTSPGVDATLKANVGVTVDPASHNAGATDTGPDSRKNQNTISISRLHTENSGRLPESGKEEIESDAFPTANECNNDNDNERNVGNDNGNADNDDGCGNENDVKSLPDIIKKDSDCDDDDDENDEKKTSNGILHGEKGGDNDVEDDTELGAEVELRPLVTCCHPLIDKQLTSITISEV